MIRDGLGRVASLHVWRVAPADVPRAVARVATQPRRLRRDPDIRFVKLCGTTRSGRFGLRAADPLTWLSVASFGDEQAADRFDGGRAVAAWGHRASEHFQARLRPIAARGRWSGCAPFDVQPGWTGPVIALTRARLRLRRAASFWRAVPAPAAALADGTGVLLAFGFGEAPVGVQGTLSLWPDRAAMRRYAYGRAAHRAVVARTRETGWYAEELFAEFGVLSASGTLDGVEPLRAGR